jgi:serine/threonine protein kinase
MAPEQIDGQSFGGVDERTDVWQLGVLAVQLFSDRLPFDAEDPSVLTSQVLMAEPDLSGIPEALRASINRALSKSKDERWRTAAEFSAALREAYGSVR